MKEIETKLYIEEDKSIDKCNIVIRIESLATKEQALEVASYIFITKQIDFTDILLAPDSTKRTLH
tara:strand:- start:230 stop:424 length:195 start_codon:yes stop_codon:yes gene_type:complete